MADCVADLETFLGRKLPANFVPEFRARSADVFRTRLQPVAGALELIQSLSASSQPICVASSGPMEKIELNLSLTGLTKGRFTQIEK